MPYFLDCHRKQISIFILIITTALDNYEFITPDFGYIKNCVKMGVYQKISNNKFI